MPPRLIVGFGFIQHGYANLARGPEDFINVLHAMASQPLFCLAGHLGKGAHDQRNPQATAWAA
jgi:hypothetical protein